LIDGESNWYKYVVPGDFLARRTTGKVYARTDQLNTIMGIEADVPNSEYLANNHVCLPIGEGMYDDMNLVDMLNYLMGAL